MRTIAPKRPGALLAAVCLAAALALPLCGCGVGAEAAGSEEQTPGSTPDSTSIVTQTPPGANEEEHPMVEINVKDYGTMKLELDAEAAPITVQNFLDLVNDGFYDGLTFHRIVQGFMIQGGGPEGTGTGGPGHQIKGEFAENDWNNPISHQRGTISMARSGDPDSAGSQFFITDGDATFLDGKYAAFGRVVEGLDVLDAIAAAETDFDRSGREKSVPLEPPVIESIHVVE